MGITIEFHGVRQVGYPWVQLQSSMVSDLWVSTGIIMEVDGARYFGIHWYNYGDPWCQDT